MFLPEMVENGERSTIYEQFTSVFIKYFFTRASCRHLKDRKPLMIKVSPILSCMEGGERKSKGLSSTIGGGNYLIEQGKRSGVQHQENICRQADQHNCIAFLPSNLNNASLLSSLQMPMELHTTSAPFLSHNHDLTAVTYRKSS